MLDETAAYRLIQADSAQRAFVARRLAAIGLHVGQELLLSHLMERDGLTQSELMAFLRCSAPTVTKAVQRLERIGLVRRERGGTPRVSRVYLTEPGWALREPIAQIWEQTESRLSASLSAADHAALAAMLDRVAESFRAG